MITIKLVIANPYKTTKIFNLFENVNKPELPVFVYIQTQHSWEAIEYKKLVAQITVDPPIVNVQKSTNNRQLNFYNITMWGMKPHVEPHLTIDKKPRPRKKLAKLGFTNDENLLLAMSKMMDYKTKWNPKKWNIADTAEQFLLTHHTVCIEVIVLPSQKFEIHFKIDEHKRIINDTIPTSVLQYPL